MQLCGDRRPPTARALLYPQAWTVDLTDGLKSEKGYANEVTAYPQDNRVLRSAQICRLASPADSEVKLEWLNEARRFHGHSP